MQFLTILLPIFSIFILGFIVGKSAELNVQSLSYVAIHVFYPFLAFETFYSNPITIDFFYVFIGITLLIFTIYLLVVLISMILKYDKKRTHAMLLATVFMNGGNYGLPVVLFMLGKSGFAYAMIIMVIMSVYMNSLGLYIAASGGGDTVSKRQALFKVLKTPILLAVVTGIIFQLFHINLPTQINDIVVLLSDAAIPLIMIILGIQLSTIPFREIAFKPVGTVVLMRLVLSPLIAIGIVHLLGMEGTLMATVFIIIAAMPSAANTTIFSVQFNVDPVFVSSSTFASTLLSLLTLPLLFYYL